MPARRALLIAAILAALAGGCGSDDEGAQTPVAGAVERQLGYLDPRSSAILVFDVRFDGPNWKRLREHAERGLAAYREAAPPDAEDVPGSVDEALEELARDWGELSFADDVAPVLDGHLVVGISIPPVEEGAEPEELARTVFAFRTEGEGLERLVERLSGEKPKPHPDHDDVKLYAETAVVGGDTLVWAAQASDEREALDAAIRRAKDDGGFPADRLADAERRAGLDDPFLLAAADPTIARALVAEPNLRRALDEVPWLGAIRSLTGAVRIDEGGAELAGVVATDEQAVQDADLPLAPPGDLDLPRSDAVAGASRDQSFTTTFLSRTVRALFADSEFAKAVEEAERDLGVRFEDEVLRQFSCPSMSEMEPGSQRFAARSCVRDPERMRELLPKLSEHLPRIIRTMQGLDEEGLITLLLIAPDAPLTPSFAPVAQIQVEPAPQEGAAEEETLYEVTGLRDNARSEIAGAGPDRVVFGMIGDAFVVASDREMARRAADFEGDRLDEPAASAIRAPLRSLLGEDDTAASAPENALYDLLGAIEVTASADRAGLKARGRLDLGD
ncbi:MAG TPA: hypothetical protein VHF89_06370 [Solirubrobacteraceae bacterium]|nr:hypothetical protein [Solirubrobacteraceae bacterium]